MGVVFFSAHAVYSKILVGFLCHVYKGWITYYVLTLNYNLKQ